MRFIDQKQSGPLAAKAVMLLWVLLLIVACTSCSGQDATSRHGSPTQIKCVGITDARDWPNPYIVVSAKGVSVYFKGTSIPQHEMPLNQLAAYLKQLPKSAWPCGNVVAAQQNGISPNGGPITEENSAKVDEILKGLKMKVDWWPSA